MREGVESLINRYLPPDHSIFIWPHHHLYTHHVSPGQVRGGMKYLVFFVTKYFLVFMMDVLL